LASKEVNSDTREADEPIAEMIAIFSIAWVLVLVGTIVIFEYIVPFTYCACFYDSIAKAGLAIVLAVVWLLAMVAMRDVMVRRTILRRRVK
jgi:hypothetical protein